MTFLSDNHSLTCALTGKATDQCVQEKSLKHLQKAALPYKMHPVIAHSLGSQTDIYGLSTCCWQQLKKKNNSRRCHCTQ